MNSQALITVLVALIGSAGVIGAALVTQVWGHKAERAAAVVVDNNGEVKAAGVLYQQIGRLEAELEDCREDLRKCHE